MQPRRRLSLPEVFGLSPLSLAASQAALVLRGDPLVPPARFDRTSLAMVTPRLSVATWLGRKPAGRVIPLLNLFNHTPTAPEDGWSVRFTRVRDFRGRGLTYDSHNGTDLVIPPGTVTVAAAAGRVVSIRREFNRGGLKVYLDHGAGLMTSHHHLGRALVAVGDRVTRGQPVALTAYSGLDGLSTFPWVAPHVHYNVTLGGVLVDPFAPAGDVSLWRDANAPRPALGPALPEDDVPPTTFSPGGVAALLDDLRDDGRRATLGAIADPTLRAFELIIEATVYPTRFATPDAGRLLFADPPPRTPRLDLPFTGSDYDGVGFADDLGFR